MNPLTCTVYTHAGLKHCKMNVHLLSHLPHYVKLFGPLWTHSAFVFEDAIGYLVKKAHGTRDITDQVYIWVGGGLGGVWLRVIAPLHSISTKVTMIMQCMFVFIDCDFFFIEVATSCSKKAIAWSS